MIIETKNFNMFSKHILSNYKKSDNIMSHMFLSFTDKYVFVIVNPKYKLAFRFSFEMEEGDSPIEEWPVISVEISFLLNICKEFDKIRILKGENFSYKFEWEEEEFKIPVSVDDFYFSDMTPIDFQTASQEDILILPKSYVKQSKKLLPFMGQTFSRQSLNLIGDKATVSDGSFCVPIQETGITVNNPVCIPDYIVSFIALADNEINFLIDNHYLWKDKDSLKHIYQMDKTALLYIVYTCDEDEYTYTDIAEEEFISEFNHEDTFDIEKIDLKKLIDFLSPFISTIANGAILSTFGEDSMRILAKGVETEAKRVIPISNVSKNLLGIEEYLPITFIASTMGVYTDATTLRFHMDVLQEKHGFMIEAIDKDKKNHPIKFALRRLVNDL